MKKFMVVLMMLTVVEIFGLDIRKREPKPSVLSYKMTDGIFKLFVHDYVNMFLFNGPDGAMLIDTGFDPVNLIADELKRLNIGKILFIVNTHSNGDHILGNTLLGKEAVIISHTRCRERMAKREGFPAEGLPDLVFKDEISLSFNGENIRMTHLPGHTDNDIVIHFQKAKMVFIGDLVFSDSFPGIQAFTGGNVFDLEKSLRTLTEIFPPEVTFLVGHGRDYSMKDIRKYHTMVRQTIDIVTEMIRKGMDLDKIKNRHPLRKWESWNSEFFPGEISIDTWIENIYESYSDDCNSIPNNGPYLGQNPPGMIPEVFAPGIISKGFHELGISISARGDEIFYVTSDREYKLYNIIRLMKVNNQWMPPEVAPFSGFYIDNSLCFSADGNSLFFRSKRPLGGAGNDRNDGNFWVVEKNGGEWSHPVMLEGPVNTEKNELALSVAANGTIYFSAVYEPEFGGDIFRSIRKNGKYMLPEKLEWGISTKHGEGRPYISPDENYLLFQSDRPGSLGQNDIYVSFKEQNESWGEPVNLGAPVNSEASEFAPSVSPDGRYLFFSSYRTMNPNNFEGKTYHELMSLYRDPRNGYATLFWVDAKIIDNARTKTTEK